RDVDDKVGLGRPHRRRRLFDDGDLLRSVRVRARDDKTGPRKHEGRDTDEKWPGHARKREPHATSWLADKCVSAVVIFDDSLSSIRASALLLLLHLHDRDRQTADGAAVDLEVELVDAVAREAHVVELDDHVDVLPGHGVHGDLGRIRHRLLPVGSEQPHADSVGADLEAKDGDDEHSWMLRRQPTHRDVAEDPHEADLSVLSDKCGAKGASRSTSVSIPYSRLVPRARESVVESSIIAAIAVLKW